jgi:hypothetical protein
MIVDFTLIQERLPSQFRRKKNPICLQAVSERSKQRDGSFKKIETPEDDAVKRAKARSQLQKMHSMFNADS